MKTCISFEDLLHIHRPQIDEMRTVGESFSNPNSPEASEAFGRHVRIVEGTLRQTYREAAALAKRTKDLGEVGEIWSAMSTFCNRALQSLAAFRDKYPDCGTSEAHDLALDYKLACDQRYRGVLEEIECQSTEVPKGLFPERI
jgi:hypothetical protein